MNDRPIELDVELNSHRIQVLERALTSLEADTKSIRDTLRGMLWTMILTLISGLGGLVFFLIQNV